MKNPEVSSDEQSVQDDLQDEPFLSRWSRRKLNSAADKNKSKDVAEEQSADINHPEPETTDLEIEQPQVELTDADMPPLEELNENSDFSGFFSPKVSEALRKQALRKLFHFQQFNITDGLNDYDEDYTQFAGLGNIITHDMKRMLNSEAEILKAEQPMDELEESEESIEEYKKAADDAGGDTENTEDNPSLAENEKQVEDEVAGS